MKKVLTDQQIKEAKSLKESGKTKRQLAQIFEVGETTIWENVFSTQKRVRIYTYIPRKKEILEKCVRCEIGITREIKGNFIPFNFKIGDRCISCYLEERGFHYIDAIKQ